ncbi:hypothetical protein, partial [Limosilactobacillus reuteri]|uniref:hypothetical protein n=1 Tax=Limosilactobacillus reuteri TaxID=1598 RepID=UPI00207C6904
MALDDGYIYVNDGLGALAANWVNSGQKAFPVDVASKSDITAPILTPLEEKGTFESLPLTDNNY